MPSLTTKYYFRFLFHELPIEYNSCQRGDHLGHGEGQPEAVQTDLREEISQRNKENHGADDVSSELFTALPTVPMAITSTAGAFGNRSARL